MSNTLKVLQPYHLHKDEEEDLVSRKMNDTQYYLLPASAVHHTKLFHPDSPINQMFDNFCSISDVIGDRWPLYLGGTFGQFGHLAI